MRRLLCLGLALSLAACGGDPDKTPPPPPNVDPIASPTAATEILVTGSAEPGSIIEITGAASVEPAQIVVDQFTATFRAYVTLNPDSVNTLSFTATDAEGNRSEPTTITVEHVAGFGVGLVSIQNLHVNGVPCVPTGEPLACTVRPDDLVEFDVAAANIDAVELGYSAWFQQVSSLRSVSVFVPADAQSPVMHFRFNVPGSLFEVVPLVAHAVDGSGSEYTSASYLLRVTLEAGDRAIALVAAQGLVNGPNDVVVDAAGNVFIANDGDSNLLEVPAGSTIPNVFSPYDRNSRYLAIASNGDLYVTDNNVYRVPADGLSFDNYANNTPGNARGLSVVGATVAKALVDASGSADGDSIDVGSITYELDSDGLCTPSATLVCVDIMGVANINAELAAAIDLSVDFAATHDATADAVVIAAALAGEAGNAATLAGNNVVVIAGFQGGHEEEVFVAADGDQLVFRLPEDLVPTADIAADSHGVFDVLAPQLGLEVSYASTASSYDVFDAYFYFIDDGNNDSLIGIHQVDDPAVNTSLIFDTNHGGQFDTLYDVAQAPNGCLLVSDEAAGNIWSVDVRDPADTTPAIMLVASGFDRPRGLTFSGTDLYVADRGFDTVVKISASPTASCF